MKREYDKLKEDEKTLADILSQLRAGYNPNYQDMAVLEAVRGWEFYAGLPHIGDTDNSSSGEDEGTDTTSVDDTADVPPDEPLEEGMWSKEKLERSSPSRYSARTGQTGYVGYEFYSATCNLISRIQGLGDAERIEESVAEVVTHSTSRQS